MMREKVARWVVTGLGSSVFGALLCCNPPLYAARVNMCNSCRHAAWNDAACAFEPLFRIVLCVFLHNVLCQPFVVFL